ncbi:MAG: RNA polymerase sigma factor [Chthonomonadales bacterium]
MAALDDAGCSPVDIFEARMVRRLRNGDREALDGLFDMYVDRVYGYARSLLGNREDAEEVAAEAFLRVFQNAASFRCDAPFRIWLFAIVRNLCRDRLRQPRLPTWAFEEAPASSAEEEERAAIHADVRAALSRLPQEYREVLLLCDVQEWNAPEAATILDRSVPATKSLLYRARRALRAHLAECWREE